MITVFDEYYGEFIPLFVDPKKLLLD